jgi:hypothetical protein
MNIALFAQSGIFRLLQTFAHWCAAGPAVNPQKERAPSQSGHRIAPILIATSLEVTVSSALFDPQRKPLRVVRVLEAGQSRSSVGRIVISGRMADVCAELDRLAAGEAALS